MNEKLGMLSQQRQKSDASAALRDRELRAGFICGRVTSLQQRIESFEVVRDFRLERQGPDGTFLAPVAVELRSSRYTGFEGSILNGDEIEVAAHPAPAKTLKVGEVLNLTSNSVVRQRNVFAWAIIPWKWSKFSSCPLPHARTSLQARLMINQAR